jgi:hypothetical protein
MLFTYKDKGPATVFAYPSNQRPMTKYDSIEHIAGKPNPIKHWRKQLKPSVNTTVIQSHPTIQALENATNTQSLETDLCKSYNDIFYIDKCGDTDSKKCIEVTRSANTIINKNFCWNSKQYLQSRCKTYHQNQSLGIHVDGPVYFGASCKTDSSNNICKPVIYKPNNSKFKQQGGVSSSSRIAKLKYDTIRYSTNKYDSLLANLDQSAHVLNRKPVPCRGWRPRGKRHHSETTNACNQTSNVDNI